MKTNYLLEVIRKARNVLEIARRGNGANAVRIAGDVADNLDLEVKALDKLKGEDAERDEILATLPSEHKNLPNYSKPNCFVVVEGDRLGIYPEDGGALFAQIEDLRADIAPGH